MDNKSQWVQFRDSIIDSLKFDTVTEKMKDFTNWLTDTCLPMAETSAADFVSQIIEQSKSETGWCKVRDLIVLPFIIKLGLWAIKNSLQKSVVKS